MIQPAEGQLLAIRVLRLRDAAEDAQGFAARVRRIQTLPDELRRSLRRVARDLFTQVVILRPPPEQPPRASEARGGALTDGSSWILKKRATMSVAFAREASSAFSWRRPAFVNA
jgi:hypothetical protein